ncbi:MAG: aminopeptidase N, partial [Acidiferrobacterales bacterium]|nr:aminopeptidase N [Acidiferrobacterales bacterium]
MLETDLKPTVRPKTIYLKDYETPAFLVPKTELQAQLGETTTITARLSLKRNGRHTKPIELDGEKMTLLSLKLNGQTLKPQDFELESERLVIPTELDKVELEIETRLRPKLNTELSGLYQSSGNYCTQCEAEGFRRITYFPDRPDVLSEFSVTLIADKQQCPVLLSNGNLIDHGDNSDGTHWARWHDPHPKPSYLFAIVAGDLEHISDSFITTSGREVALNIYTQSHNIQLCDHAMSALKNSMVWDEKTYGREYDLSVYNIVAVDDFNMGAMENKGLNIFNSKYVLADQQTATDTDFEGIESVIGHEYFHNWSGNRVTCRDWFQLSLKEGFTVFRDQEFSADMGSRAVKRIRDVQILRAHQFKEDAGPMAHPVRPDSYEEINNFYTVTIYNKGAEVIRMMHSLVGANGFRKGTDMYFARFDGQAVTTEDFVRCIEEANEIDLSQFRLWYTQSGTPEVSVETEFADGVFSITLTQKCPATPGQDEKAPFHIPIKMALFETNGAKLKEETLVLAHASQTFRFEGLSASPCLSILRDFSAPIKLNLVRSNAELAALIRADDNDFSRWEAMQELSLSLILPALSAGALDEKAYQHLLSSFKDLIASSPQDKAVFAEMLTLPTSAYIAGLVTPIDPQKVANIREQCVKRLARDLESEFHAIYANNNQRKEFSLQSDAIAERALKNRALAYLVATDQAAYHALASHQYHVANNMTDRLAAFSALTHSSYPDRQSLIDHFYEQWQEQTLVMDKWFALQATYQTESTLDDVVRLSNHAAFSTNNPNKVRSLFGAFTSNLIGFHRADGKGYEFITDKVIELNEINPQIAARLVSTFNNWRTYAEPFNTLMQAQLLRIQKQK